MSEQNKKKEFNDIFIVDSIYPEANSIFKISLKGLEEIKNDCYIVLDTNVLLVPYTTSKESLAQIRKTYEALISEARLIIPVQVAREFAKNRANKLIELYQDLCKKRDENIQLKKGRYPLLEFLDEYQEVIRLEDAIETQLRAYRQAIGKVLAHIKGWNWNDPVSLLYAELFNDSVILSPQIDKEEITKDLSKRQQHNIPPGYEDSSKPDKGVGDLLIWHTILEVGKTRKKSVIFVSGEKKPDWWHKKGNDALYPRYELVDEFRRCSEGKSFHIMELSHLLQLYGASETVVEEVRQEENQVYREEVNINLGSRVENAVFEWLKINRLGKKIQRNYPGFPDFIEISLNGDKTGIETMFSRQNIYTHSLKQIIQEYNSNKSNLKISTLHIFLASDDNSIISKWIENLTETAFKLRDIVQINNDVLLLVGYLSSDDQLHLRGSLPL
jgi:rRNA-processing protein FCF1